MLASVSDPDNLDVLVGLLSRFLSWHRERGTDGFSQPLNALWIGGEPTISIMPPVRESAGISGRWMLYRFEDDNVRRLELKQALTVNSPGAASVSATGTGPLEGFFPVLPHDVPPADLLRCLLELDNGGSAVGSGYLLQHRDAGRLLSSIEHDYPVRPLF